MFAPMPEVLDALQKVAEERLLDKFDASLGGAKTSDGAGSGSAGGDVAGPLTFSQGSGKGGSLVGGGEKTLPPGFADAVSTSIGNVLDEVSIDRERTQAVEKRVAALESSVARGFMTVTAQLEQIAARLDASAATAALVPTALPSPRHHAAAATTVAGDVTGGAAHAVRALRPLARRERLEHVVRPVCAALPATASRGERQTRGGPTRSARGLLPGRAEGRLDV